MKKARAEAEATVDSLPYAHGMPHGLQRLCVFSVHWNVAKNCEVVGGSDSRKMRLQNLTESLPGGKRGGISLVGKKFGVFRCEERRFRGQASRGFILAGEFFRFDLAGLDVGLVECIDADDRARNGSSDFPAEKFLAEGVHVRERDLNDWMTGLFERRNGRIVCLVRFVRELQISDNAAA